MPPTYDHSALINGLPKKAELEGTALGDAITEAVDVAKKAVGPSKPGQPHPPATILLVSDGGSNAGADHADRRPPSRAREGGDPGLDDRLGTAGGRRAPERCRSATGKKTFPLVQQVPVDPKTLQAVAAASGGQLLRGDLGEPARPGLQGARQRGSSTPSSSARSPVARDRRGARR